MLNRLDFFALDYRLGLLVDYRLFKDLLLLLFFLQERYGSQTLIFFLLINHHSFNHTAKLFILFVIEHFLHFEVVLVRRFISPLSFLELVVLLLFLLQSNLSLLHAVIINQIVPYSFSVRVQVELWLWVHLSLLVEARIRIIGVLFLMAKVLGETWLLYERGLPVETRRFVAEI